MSGLSALINVHHKHTWRSWLWASMLRTKLRSSIKSSHSLGHSPATVLTECHHQLTMDVRGYSGALKSALDLCILFSKINELFQKNTFICLFVLYVHLHICQKTNCESVFSFHHMGTRQAIRPEGKHLSEPSTQLLPSNSLIKSFLRVLSVLRGHLSLFLLFICLVIHLFTYLLSLYSPVKFNRKN